MTKKCLGGKEETKKRKGQRTMSKEANGTAHLASSETRGGTLEISEGEISTHVHRGVMPFVALGDIFRELCATSCSLGSFILLTPPSPFPSFENPFFSRHFECGGFLDACPEEDVFTEWCNASCSPEDFVFFKSSLFLFVLKPAFFSRRGERASPLGASFEGMVDEGRIFADNSASSGT